MTDEQWAARQAQGEAERDIIRRAARRLRELAAGAPEGPYTLDPHTQPDGGRWLLGPDGDPIATVNWWSGGVVDGTGSADQTGRHLAVWGREAATVTAALLEGLDVGMGMWAPFHDHEHGYAPWASALALSRRILSEPQETPGV
ncbi:hypothetical protein [Nocardiopsis sp. FR26]|uniref:hypothetical protein n=1 Tax=Nocardiopsis sp. FR26 TaxID=2605987 RepID=UPI00135A3CF9|nr:hypothetical protein [Nocardiopsis sp. FR26]